jgi:hypothetical protein
LLAGPAEAVGAFVEAFEAVELGVGGHYAGDVLVVSVVIELAVVSEFMDRNGCRAAHQQGRQAAEGTSAGCRAACDWVTR